MNKTEKESINRENVNVTRQTNEPEDMDLAAEATAGAPAKSLELDRKPAPAAPRRRIKSKQDPK